MTLLRLLFLSLYLLSLHESPIFLRVYVEYHAIDNDYLGKESKCITSHIRGRIVQPANNSFKKSEVVMPGDNVGFCEFEKNFTYFCSTISWFIHKTLVEKFQKLFFGGMINHLSVRIPSFLS